MYLFIFYLILPFLITCCFNVSINFLKLEKNRKHSKMDCVPDTVHSRFPVVLVNGILQLPQCHRHQQFFQLWICCNFLVSWTPAFCISSVSRTPAICDSWCPGHWEFYHNCKAHESTASGTPAICDFPVFQTPRCHDSPVSWTPGNRFKTTIAPQSEP